MRMRSTSEKWHRPTPYSLSATAASSPTVTGSVLILKTVAKQNCHGAFYKADGISRVSVDFYLLPLHIVLCLRLWSLAIKHVSGRSWRRKVGTKGEGEVPERRKQHNNLGMRRMCRVANYQVVPGNLSLLQLCSRLIPFLVSVSLLAVIAL